MWREKADRKSREIQNEAFEEREREEEKVFM